MIDFSLMIDYLRGRSSKGYELFGAHFVWENNQSQVRFAVYAPQAKVVSLIGDFNAWNPWPMQRLDCGVWVLTSPDPQPGDRYKYRITTAGGRNLGPGRPLCLLHRAAAQHRLGDSAAGRISLAGRRLFIHPAEKF